MIGVCSKCTAMFETTTEDAYTPGVLCPTCYKDKKIAELETRLRNTIHAANKARIDLHYAIDMLADIERHCVKENDTGYAHTTACHALDVLGITRKDVQQMIEQQQQEVGE